MLCVFKIFFTWRPAWFVQNAQRENSFRSQIMLRTGFARNLLVHGSEGLGLGLPEYDLEPGPGGGPGGSGLGGSDEGGRGALPTSSPWLPPALTSPLTSSLASSSSSSSVLASSRPPLRPAGPAPLVGPAGAVPHADFDLPAAIRSSVWKQK